MTEFSKWKDDEYSYCRGLILSHGDANVGQAADAVASYLHVQGVSARRDGEYHLASNLLAAAMALRPQHAISAAHDVWQNAVVYMPVQE